ncbi:hypothetical protein FMEAI12_5100024 [Parafrankia sp. Ea1.12]|nr:hypothetical protein FMEAI12_5100024 [Parafrankia sp. Ea1.12]
MFNAEFAKRHVVRAYNELGKRADKGVRPVDRGVFTYECATPLTSLHESSLDEYPNGLPNGRFAHRELSNELVFALESGSRRVHTALDTSVENPVYPLIQRC